MADGAPHPQVRPRGRVLRAEELDGWLEARDALIQARREAAVLLARAQGERAEERRRGHAEGLAAGLEEAAQVLAVLSARAEAAEAAREAALPALVADLVTEVVGALDGDERVRRALAHGLARVRRGPDAVLRVHPAAAEAARAAVAELPAGAPRVEPDEALGPEDAVLESGLGVVALGLPAQLRALRAALLAAGEEAAPGEAA